MESFLNERLQEDKDKLRALDPESSGLVILNSPDMFGAPHLRLHNMELYQTINLPPFLGVIPEEEAEWNDEWQAKFDLLMLIQHLQFEMGVYRQKQAHLLAFSEDLEELFKQLDMLMSAWTNPASVAEPEA
ncbi:MAG TPA: hypothetical protein VLA04_04830 [Verrucomicrobiae bacterium]|nr:hypothetical protein [Verrucomicrobiae bacterium]